MLPMGALLLERHSPEDYTIVDANQAAEQSGWKGISRESIIGRNLVEVFPGVKEYGLLKMYNRALDDQETTQLGRIEYEDANVSSGVFDVLLVPLSKNVVMLLYENITNQVLTEERLEEKEDKLQESNEILHETIMELRKAEMEIRTLNTELEERIVERTAKLEEANKELESFSYSISHDLRAPLRSLAGFSKILIENHPDELNSKTLHYLKRIWDNTNVMHNLINDLLQFSRLNRTNLNKKIIDPVPLINDVLKQLQPMREGRCIEVEIEDLPHCQADPALLRQVFANLIGNALKYTKKKVVAHIKIGSFVDRGERTFFVEDNGTGFDMEYAGKLFTPFQRLHKKEDYEGTGIGLAIVQRIVHRHGGRVWAESEIDKGATFYFTLK